MCSRSRRTTVSRLRGEEGSVLVTVVLISFLIGALGALALANGRQADSSSTSDRNREDALAVAETGLNQVVARISAQAAAVNPVPNFWGLAACKDSTSVPEAQQLPRLRRGDVSCPTNSMLPARSGTCITGRRCEEAKPENDVSHHYSGNNSHGRYWYWVTRFATPALEGFIVDAQSTAGVRNGIYERGRHVQIVLVPPFRFESKRNYALFSNTTIGIDNNDQVLGGDVYAKTSISICNSVHKTEADPTVKGSLTSETGSIELGNVYITGAVWSGGFHGAAQGTNGFCGPVPSTWAISLGGQGTLGAAAQASSTVPACQGETAANYNVVTDNGSLIKGSLTTFGAKTGGGQVNGTLRENTCTASSAPEPFPTFTYQSINYGPQVYHDADCPPPATRNGVCEFSSLSAFETWLATGTNKTDFRGAFRITASPSDTANWPPGNNNDHRVDLTGVVLKGSATIITDGPAPYNGIPITTGSLNDQSIVGSANLVIVSHYHPVGAVGETPCDTEHTQSDCAVHVTNGFDASGDAAHPCKTSTLIYADKGPVSIKNNQEICGAIIADPILVKNDQTVVYDDRVGQVVGFGSGSNETFVIDAWQELPSK